MTILGGDEVELDEYYVCNRIGRSPAVIAYLDSGRCAFGSASHGSREDKMKQYFSFQWHITDDCDQRCKHCYIFSENCHKKLDSMSWEQM